MSATPVVYEQDPPLQRSRLTVFFRGILVIPQVIFAWFYSIGVIVVVILAWFVLLFTGRWPAGMYNFVTGGLRYFTRVYGYMLLVCDQYPPFDGDEHPDYPVRLVIGPAQESYSRLTVFFRLILAIPIFILQYIFELWLIVVTVGIWFVAVIMGKTGPGLMEAMRIPMSYYARSTAYIYLVTDRWPPITDAPR